MEKKITKNFIKSTFINLIVIATSVIYALYGMVNLEKTGLSMLEVLCKASIGLIVGFTIKQTLSENGFTKGYSSGIWQENLDKYSNACNIANPYIERVDNFYDFEEIDKKRKYRRTNMMSAQMKYDWFFDKNGDFIDNPEKYNTLKRHQKRVLKKCIRVKIYNLNLFSEYSNEIENETHKEKTDNAQRAKMFRKNSISAIIPAVLGVYFIPTWTSWDWGSFITSFTQVAIWISCGIIQMYTNYNYIVIDKVAKLTKKIETIVKFSKGCEQGLYTRSPYDKEPYSRPTLEILKAEDKPAEKAETTVVSPFEPFESIRRIYGEQKQIPI